MSGHVGVGFHKAMMRAGVLMAFLFAVAVLGIVILAGFFDLCGG